MQGVEPGTLRNVCEFKTRSVYRRCLRHHPETNRLRGKVRWPDRLCAAPVAIRSCGREILYGVRILTNMTSKLRLTGSMPTSMRFCFAKNVLTVSNYRDLGENEFTTLPGNTFEGMTSMTSL